MANEMHRQFKAHSGVKGNYRWNPKTMHVFCFCHKLALIVGAGLTALGLKTPPPRKIKTAIRGQFPTVAATLAEEEEEAELAGCESAPAHVPDVAIPLLNDETSDVEHDLQELVDEDSKEAIPEVLDAEIDNEEDWDAADAEDEGNPVLVLEDCVAPTHWREANKLNFTLQKV